MDTVLNEKKIKVEVYVVVSVFQGGGYMYTVKNIYTGV